MTLNRLRCSWQKLANMVMNFSASFQAPSASVVGEIKDALWSRDVTSVNFWLGAIWNAKTSLTSKRKRKLKTLRNSVSINCKFLLCIEAVLSALSVAVRKIIVSLCKLCAQTLFLPIIDFIIKRTTMEQLY